MCLLGYPIGVKCYKVMNLSTKAVFVSRDVYFHENIFPFATTVQDFSDPFVTEVDASTSAIDPFITPVSIPNAPIESSPPCNSLISPSQPSSTPSPSSTPPCVPLVTSDSLDTTFFVPNIPNVDPSPTRKSTRTRKTLVYLQDYACNSAAISPSTTSSHVSGTPYDIADCLTYCHLDPNYQSYLMTVSHGHQAPQYFHLAVTDPLWREAMDKEIQALEQTHT